VLASLSVDLDDLWSYLRVHGDPRWESLPSYLHVVVPRVLERFSVRSLSATFFLVGQDCEVAENASVLASIPRAGHEIGNHSFHHETWLHLKSLDEIRTEVRRAENAIHTATGVRPSGFRGPGYSLSRNVLRALVEAGYHFDASTFPSVIGPLARAYYLATTKLEGEERERRKALFGTWRDGLKPLAPHRLLVHGGAILELPVTTHPDFRTPFHMSYIIYVAGFSRVAALAYWRNALSACLRLGVEPSVLLHPLDFLGPEEAPNLSFFPGMGMPASRKLEILSACLDALQDRFEVVPIGRYAARVMQRPDLRSEEPKFAGVAAGGG
jgi:hypothetical protein